MKELLLGAHAADGGGVLAFDSSFATQVGDAGVEFLGELTRVPEWPQKLDLLLAFTYHLDQYDAWVGGWRPILSPCRNTGSSPPETSETSETSENF